VVSLTFGIFDQRSDKSAVVFIHISAFSTKFHASATCRTNELLEKLTEHPKGIARNFPYNYLSLPQQLLIGLQQSPKGTPKSPSEHSFKLS